MNLNYASKDNWVYGIDYQSECIFEEGKEKSKKNTNIKCTLDGNVTKDKERLNCSLKDVNIESELYNDDTRKQITDKLSKATYSLALINGYPNIDSEIDLSSDGVPEWDLYIQLVRLLPEMPERPVKKGFTWERNAVLPIKTPHGKVQCEVYRLFKIDKFSPKKDTAYISWQFRYTANEPTMDSSSVLKYVPFTGNGKGTATVDIKKGILVDAGFEFETEVASLENVKVKWKEKASLKHKN